jgi:hypothetical protein
MAAMEPERYEAEIFEPEKKKKNEEYYLEPEPPRRRRRWPWFVLGGCAMLCCLCLVVPLVFLSVGGVAFSAMIAGSEVTERGTEQIDVTGDALAFTVQNDVGDVTIETGAEGAIVVDYVKRAYSISRGEARDRLNDVVIRLEETAEGEVSLTVESPSSRFSLVHIDSVDLVISVPPDTVYDLVASVDVGSLRIGNDVQVSHVDAQVDVGSIALHSTLSEDLTDSRLRVDVGEVSLDLPEDAYLRVEGFTDVGDISVDPALDVSGVDHRQEVTNERWTGTFGSGEGTAPLLEITIDVGEIRINAQ